MKAIKQPQPQIFFKRRTVSRKFLMSAMVSALAGTVASFFSIGCVSVNIGPKAGERSKGVEFVSPPAPYQVIKATPADGAWQSKANGNSISYFSACNDPADPALETVARDLFTDLKDMRTIASQTATYNSREAIDVEVEGKVDGILTRIRSVVFKKNGCIYTLSHIGIPKSFNEDRVRFNEFLKSFQAP